MESVSVVFIWGRRLGGLSAGDMWGLYLFSLSGVCICCLYLLFYLFFVSEEKEKEGKGARGGGEGEGEKGGGDQDLLQILTTPT